MVTLSITPELLLGYRTRIVSSDPICTVDELREMVAGLQLEGATAEMLYLAAIVIELLRPISGPDRHQCATLRKNAKVAPGYSLELEKELAELRIRALQTRLPLNVLYPLAIDRATKDLERLTTPA